MTSKIIIINGPPGVGKSTTSELLAQFYQNSVYIRGDDIKHWIINKNSSTLARGLTYINGATCCHNYVQAGYEFIIFDYVFTKKIHVERFTENSRIKHCCFLFTLIAPLSIIKQREQLRQNRKPLGEAIDIAYNEITQNKADLGIFINTEFLSPSETCELIQVICS